FRQLLFHAESEGGDAFHLAFLHALSAYGDVIGTGVGIGKADQNFVALLDRGAFKVEHDLREKWIATAQLGDDEAHGVTAAARQSTRLEVGPIAHFLNDGLHAAHQFWIDRFNLIDDAGNGGMRNTSSLGNLPDIHALSSKRTAAEEGILETGHSRGLRFGSEYISRLRAGQCQGTVDELGLVVSHPFAKSAKGWGTDAVFCRRINCRRCRMAGADGT